MTAKKNWRMDRLIEAQKTPTSYAKESKKKHKSYDPAEDLPRY